jgi:hypothetical protein
LLTGIGGEEHGWSGINFREVLQSHELLLSLAWRETARATSRRFMGLFWVVFCRFSWRRASSRSSSPHVATLSSRAVCVLLFTFTGLLAVEHVLQRAVALDRGCSSHSRRGIEDLLPRLVLTILQRDDHAV